MPGLPGRPPAGEVRRRVLHQHDRRAARQRLRIHDALPAIYEYGRFPPGSILVVDTQGADCEGHGAGLGRRRRRPPRAARPGDPDPGRGSAPTSPRSCCRCTSWTGRPTTSIRVTSFNASWTATPPMAWTPVAACELEYYLVDLERGPNGELLPARSLPDSVSARTGIKSAACPSWRPRAVPARAVGHGRRHRRAAGGGDLGVSRRARSS
ncbi:hypothetical protein ACRAWD_01880 [Caulobacter segnis]